MGPPPPGEHGRREGSEESERCSGVKQLPAAPICLQTMWMVEMWEYSFACIWGDAKIWGMLPRHGDGSATSLLFGAAPTTGTALATRLCFS